MLVTPSSAQRLPHSKCPYVGLCGCCENLLMAKQTNKKKPFMASHFPRKISEPLNRVCLFWLGPPLWFLVVLLPSSVAPSSYWRSGGFLSIAGLCPVWGFCRGRCLHLESTWALEPCSALLILFSNAMADCTSNSRPTHPVISFVGFLFLHGSLHSVMISFVYLLIIFIFVWPIHLTLSSMWIGASGLLSIPGASTQNIFFEQMNKWTN